MVSGILLQTKLNAVRTPAIFVISTTLPNHTFSIASLSQTTVIGYFNLDTTDFYPGAQLYIHDRQMDITSGS
jgi:hypothetical protein